MRAVDYVDLGRYLHDARESLNISLEQAAAVLNMRVRYLHDLESGKLDNLPGKAYIRGYIKNYSEYLRLDSTEVLQEYEKLLGRKGQDFFVPDNALNSAAPTRWIVWVCLAGIAAVYGYWYGSFYERGVIRNAVGDLPPLVAHESAVRMPQDWELCVNGDDMGCFLELQATNGIPKASEGFAFAPPVAVLQAATPEPDPSPPPDGN
jgi:transcriptional regulator with XRE-family HTH domain